MSLIVSGENVAIKMAQRLLYSDVSFALHAGEMLAVTGENGVGKTTLVRAIMGQIKPARGKIVWQEPNAVVSYVPQYRGEADAFGLRIIDFVRLNFDHGLTPWLTAAEKALLTDVLRQTNLTAIAQRRMNTASGGERQRAYLAQALVRKPQLLILDEATANLDVEAKYTLMDTVRMWQQQQELGVLLISHDEQIVTEYAQKTLLLTTPAAPHQGTEVRHV